MGSLGVGARLRIVAATAVVSLVAVFLMGLYNAHVLRESREFLHTNIMPSLKANNDVQQAFLELRRPPPGGDGHRHAVRRGCGGRLLNRAQ